jgi:hypothetical protein
MSKATTVKDVMNRFEATQIAFVEKRDGETGITSMDPRVVGRTMALMAITLSESNKSWQRFLKLIEEFETMNATE